MRKHSKNFFIVLLVVAVVGSVFYIYSAMKTVKAYSFFKPLINIADLPSVKSAVDYSKKSVDKIGEKIKNQTSVINSSVSKATNNFKNSAFEFTKENINSGLNVVGGVLRVDEKLIDNTEINNTNSVGNNEKKCE
ncbi:MAG: hypothetical protein AAB504_01075 [Patescibacteria group bacterium]